MRLCSGSWPMRECANWHVCVPGLSVCSSRCAAHLIPWYKLWCALVPPRSLASEFNKYGSYFIGTFYQRTATDSHIKYSHIQLRYRISTKPNRRAIPVEASGSFPVRCILVPIPTVYRTGQRWMSENLHQNVFGTIKTNPKSYLALGSLTNFSVTFVIIIKSKVGDCAESV